jgi:H+/Cl- antiporter ClcA
MLPFARNRVFWVLIAYAVPIGLFAGLASLGFLTVVDKGTDLVWSDLRTRHFFEGKLWWIAVTAGAGLVVGSLRVWARVPHGKGGGALESIAEAKVDYRRAPQMVLISAVSLIGGASLGPFDAGPRSGGAFGEWLSARRRLPEGMRQVNVLSGISGGIGGLLTAPFLSTLMVMELNRPRSARYVWVLIPGLIASFLGFIIFFATVGVGFLNVYEMPSYEIEEWHFFAAIPLGVVAALLSVMLGTSVGMLKRAARPLAEHTVVLATLGGVALGLIGVAVPLTLGSGQDQLAGTIELAEALGTAMLVGIVLAKIVAMAVSLATGFIGGPVMPVLFIGGTAGLAAHSIVPALPIGLTFSCLLVAIAGAVVKAPFSLVLLAAFMVGLGPIETAPAGVAVITAYLLTSGLGLLGPRHHKPADPDDRTHPDRANEENP